MSVLYVLLLAFLIGFLAGLRSLTPPAATSLAAHADWLKLPHLLWWVGSLPAAIIFSLLALFELVNDKLPKTPSRTVPMQVTARADYGRVHGRVHRRGRGAGCRDWRAAGNCRGDGRNVWRLSRAQRIGEGDRRARFCHRRG